MARLIPLALLFALSPFRAAFAASAPFPSTFPVRGKVLSLGRSFQETVMRKEACHHSSPCDGLLFKEAVVQLGGDAGRPLKIANLLLPNEFVIDCRDVEEPSWGVKALLAAFSTETERKKGFDGLIRAVDVSEIEFAPVDLEKATNRELGWAAAGPGYVAKLTVTLKFSRPVEEDLDAADLCRGTQTGTRFVNEMTMRYGETLDWLALKNFR